MWTVPLKTKTSAEVAKALASLLRRIPKPECIQTDKGGEFVNGPVIKLLRDLNITFYQSQNEETKCAIVERLIRSLKALIWRWFTASNSFRWIDHLEDFVNSYNHSYHRSIKRAPVEVTRENEDEVMAALFPAETKPDLDNIVYKYAVGQKVRICKPVGPFTKGYKPTNTEEVFTVHERLRTDPPRYKLTDYNGDVIVGSFYEPEMTLVTLPPDPEYKIEKIVGRKTVRGEKYVLVKWRGYPASQNSWEKEANLRKL
jgi:hypothetical protein